MAAVVIGAVVSAFVVANLAEFVWPGILMQGRNFNRIALLASIFISVGAFCRPIRSLIVAQILAELLFIEFIIVGLIWWFSGVVTFDAFFRSWWLGMTAYVALPWGVFSGLRTALSSRVEIKPPRRTT